MTKMVKTEVRVISRDTVKPSTTSSSLHHLEPFKLSIIDQLSPTIYVPMIFFYPITDPNLSLPQTVAHLKEALSETLTLFYPFSGRTKDNLYIHDFEAGIPFHEARVNSGMFDDSLGFQDNLFLNDFVPLKPYCKEPCPEPGPLMGVQVNIFDDGIAIGISFSHKLMDGSTSNSFLKSWSAIIRGCREEIVHPNLSQAALLFPPRDNLAEKYLALMERLTFEEKNFVTRRFVFEATAISALRDEGKSNNVPKPSRVEALTCFLWKHQIAALRASSPGTSTTIAVQAVDFRSRMKTQTKLDDAIGNIFWWAPIVLDLDDTTGASSDHKMCDLVNLHNESLKEWNSDFLETLKGEDGYGCVCELLDLMEEGTCIQPAPEIYAFSSWTRILDQVDFGWGRPFWIGLTGKVGAEYRNFTVFIERQIDEGIEAWVTLDKKQMDMLEKDPQFLSFASMNPRLQGQSSQLVLIDVEH